MFYLPIRRSRPGVGILRLLALGLMIFLYPSPGHLLNPPVYLTPPGIRAIKDPSLVIPTYDSYLNHPPEIPAYRNANGNPAKGWIAKYIGTRRFSSNQSAWVYCRVSDLAQSETWKSSKSVQPMRIWPEGTTLILEGYRGEAIRKNGARLIEILAMQKTINQREKSNKAFYSSAWCYARFTPRGDLSLPPPEVKKCHQCHSIAFYLTGDLTFTRFE